MFPIAVRKKVRKPVRRRKAAGKTGRGRKFLLFLVLLSLPLLALYFYNRHETTQITARAADFMRQVNAGRLDGAAAMTLANAVDSGELEELFNLLSREHLTYKKVRSSQLLGFTKGAAEIVFARDGNEYTAKIKMEREGDAWMVSGLPLLGILHGAFVIEENPLIIRVLYRGEENRYRMQERVDSQYGDIFYMIVLGENLLYAEKTEEQSLSRVLVRTDAWVEGEDEGVFVFREGGARVYMVEEGKKQVEEGGLSGLIPGRRGVTLHMYGDEVVAVVVEGEYEPGDIRVVLNDSTYANLDHRELQITSDKEFTITDKSGGDEYTFTPGRIISIRTADDGMSVTPRGEQPMAFPRRVQIRPAEDDGTIVFMNLRREWNGDATPYRGMIDIFAGEDGLAVVNELSIEDYLLTVVPSEMPQDFHPDTLKLQAIISRAYAYRGMLGGRFYAYGAHLDDSVNSQVYNNWPPNEAATQAIRETRGLVPFYDDEPVEAIFFSTSCGFTANSEDVWPNWQTGKFPGERVHYLRAVSQVPGEEKSLAGEEDMRRFIDTEYEDAYDADSPFFRWQVTMSRQDTEETIRRNMVEQYGRRPDLVLTLEDEGFVSREITADSLGELLDIRTVERGEGGNMMVVEIEGTGGTYRLISEYTIRFTLKPVQYRQGGAPVILELADGSARENFNGLPSAFSYFDISRDENGDIEEIAIRGGGYGHGVGLSQYGAQNMVERFFNFIEIIEHYYPGTRLLNIYD